LTQLDDWTSPGPTRLSVVANILAPRSCASVIVGVGLFVPSEFQPGLARLAIAQAQQQKDCSKEFPKTPSPEELQQVVAQRANLRDANLTKATLQDGPG